MKNGKTIKVAITMFIVILLIAILALLILKYDVEGEFNMPFNLSKIMIVSSAEGIDKSGEKDTWNFELIQNNDIYIEIDKNDKYSKKEIIDKITLDNFKVNDEPKKGDIVIYRPVQNESKIYDYSKESIIEDRIEFRGSQKTDMKNLEIANQGGRILFRYTINNLGNYVSNETSEIRHDGSILKNISLTTEDLKARVSFDMTISLVSDKQFKANILLDLPVGDVISEGTSSIEITDFKNVVFKRVNK